MDDDFLEYEEVPVVCDACYETFDSEDDQNWQSIPFALICPHCDHKMYPQPDNYRDIWW